MAQIIQLSKISKISTKIKDTSKDNSQQMTKQIFDTNHLQNLFNQSIKFNRTKYMCRIQYMHNNLNIKLTLMNQSLKIKSAALKLLFYRHINKINSRITCGNFVIKKTGTIEFRYMNILTRYYHNTLFFKNNDESKLFKKLKFQLEYSIMQFEKHLSNFLYLMDMQAEYNQRNLLMKKQTKNIELIQKILSVNTFEYQQNLSEIQKSGTHYSCNLFNLFQIYGLKIKSNQEVYYQNEELIQRFNKYLILPKILPDNDKNIINNNIFNNIFILTICENQLINETGFSKIYKTKITYVQDNTKIISKQHQNFIKKISQEKKITKLMAIKSSHKERMKHQKKILSIISNNNCIYIPKFYQSQQQYYKQSLIIDYYSFGSLFNYVNKNIRTFSLLNKIFMVCQVIRGLRFLRDNKIVHMDLKSSNILIGKQLIVRLSDFGQSYYPYISKNVNFGFTLPYAPPELFSIHQIEFNQKSDVYSLGVFMYELFFETVPISITFVGQQKLIDYFNNKNQKRNKYIRVIPENLKTYGPQKLMVILGNLCLKCMNFDPQLRPFLDWIQIQLRQSLMYIDQIF